jgi:hypothetical protein
MTLGPAGQLEKQALQQYFTDIMSAYIGYLNAQAAGAERRPYMVGVYGSNPTLDFCYQQGLANYFWKAAAPYGDPSIYTSANQWQEGIAPQQIGALNNQQFDVDVAWGDEGSWQPLTPINFLPLGYVAPP